MTYEEGVTFQAKLLEDTNAQPRPFAGKWPTRILVRVTCNERILFQYFGKPAYSVRKAWEKALQVPGAVLRLSEMDRATVLLMMTRMVVMAVDLNWSRYFPLDNPAAYLSRWLQGPKKRMLRDHQGRRYYSIRINGDLTEGDREKLVAFLNPGGPYAR